MPDKMHQSIKCCSKTQTYTTTKNNKKQSYKAVEFSEYKNP